MSLGKAAAKIQKHIEDADFLVTHSAHDEEFLASFGIWVTGKRMFDTQLLATVLLPKGPLRYSLKQLLVDLNIPFDKDSRLHNSGNDAYYNMAVFRAMIGPDA